MKATGIVRRIDDLGRVVIPKEIRKVLKIREGDPLEIFVEPEGEVILKKYSQISEIEQNGKLVCETLHRLCGLSAVLCDGNEVKFAAGEKSGAITGHQLSSAFRQAAQKRRGYIVPQEEHIELCADGEETVEAVFPIVSEGLVAGSIAALRREGIGFGECEQKLLEASAMFLSRQMEL